MRELALFIVPTYVLAVTTVLSNLLYSHRNKDTLDELNLERGGEYLNLYKIWQTIDFYLMNNLLNHW